jgi:peptide chain release factor 1
VKPCGYKYHINQSPIGAKAKLKSMSKNISLSERLEGIKLRFEEVGQIITDPSVMGDMKRYVSLSKEYKNLEPIIEAYKDYKNVLDNIQSSRDLLGIEKDEEMREMAKMELDELTARKNELEEEIRYLLIPEDPQDSKNAIVEIRAGTGGDEASIFAGDLFRMYTKYCEGRNWKVEVTSSTEGTVGGFKEVIFEVTGNDVYGTLKYESGVHRVQRVPQTETQGRVHTSAASVAVLPEADEFDIELKNEDIRRDEYCSSGPGGQSVNTTYSAIRLTHIPTGIVVTCQDQKSKLKNLDKAMAELRTRLYNLEYQKYLDEISSQRKTMVSTGDRSAKIRTYNWPQGRVTDHRITLTMYNLPAIIDGDIQAIIDKLQMAENAERLKESEMA